jgi:hypothetical protein
MRFLPRLTYSNVVATLAIFIALGGISYAATQLPRNSVGAKQIKRNAVTTAKIKNRAVTQGKVNPGLLRSIDTNAKLKVVSANGRLLGDYAGTVPSAPVLIVQVMTRGGLYSYYGSGQLMPVGSASPGFKNYPCTGTAYITTSQANFDFVYSRLAGGPSRVVYRATSGPGGPGPIRAWQYTKTSEDVTDQNLWQLDSAGICSSSGPPYTGLLAELASVPAPRDGVGPLKIR